MEVYGWLDHATLHFERSHGSLARVWRVTGPAHGLEKLPDDVLVSMPLILY